MTSWIDRSWIDRRVTSRGALNDEYKFGVLEFVSFAVGHSPSSTGVILCPCRDCRNLKYRSGDEVTVHLFQRGFLAGYTNWVMHGEAQFRRVEQTVHEERYYDAVQMVTDAFGHQYSGDDEPGSSGMEEEPNGTAEAFYQLLREATVPLYDGVGEGVSKLAVITKLLHHKSRTGCSQKNFDDLLAIIGWCLPAEHTLPSSYYEVKKLVKGLNMGYDKIDACEKDCMLYYGAHAQKTHCDYCNASRYFENSTKQKKNIPKKVLRYFPLGPRLQRLYMSTNTAGSMTYHKTREIVEGQISHPSDGSDWKRLDKIYPQFAAEPRNVRLGLATDGFSPFSNIYAKTYTVWPVIVVVYNLPQSMCMKDPYMFMSLLVPGPKSPTRDITVYLQPLVDELKSLWTTGLVTYDASRLQNFNMKAALLWTINDFPALGMTSGWSVHGSIPCPVCMDSVKPIRLKHGGKFSFFGTGRIFLPDNDPMRRNTVQFRGTETRCTPVRHTGEQVVNMIDQIGDIPPPGKLYSNVRARGYGLEHKFTHKPCFFDLPYWRCLELRHCIDVMHTEKNVLDNTLYTVLDIKGKTKDNEKARMDLKEMNIRSTMWLHPRTKFKPKAPYTVTPDQAKQVFEWLKNLKMPDGYTANISRCSNVQEMKLQGLKSHDCHVFMQKLLPVAFRDFLPKATVEALTELSQYFRDICSNVLIVADIERWVDNVARLLCKLEKQFPPSFFDSMEHVIVHLAEECLQGGTVNYRWMYPFERFMRKLKLKVKNRARVEGSIAEQYVEEELITFCSAYFTLDLNTVHNRLGRNEVRREHDPTILTVFNYPTRPFGRSSQGYVHNREIQIVSKYIVLNMPEVAPYLQEFEHLISLRISDNSEYERILDAEFPSWLKEQVVQNHDTFTLFKELLDGPYCYVQRFHGCIVNGYRFKCGDRPQPSKSSGVMVKGSCYGGEDEGDYYGFLDEVWKVKYTAGHNVIVFKCIWFDSTRHVHKDKFGLVTVDIKSRLATDDVFILASQATQVYYARNVKDPRSSKYTVITMNKRDYEETNDVEPVQEDKSSKTVDVVEDDGFRGERIDYIPPQVYDDEPGSEDEDPDQMQEEDDDYDDDDDDGFEVDLRC